MVVCPPRLDSVVVTNTMTGPVNVVVSFDNHKEQIELHEEHQIEPGASYHFLEKTLDMGSWTAVAPVKRVAVSHANGSHSLEPVVAGVVKQLELRVKEDGQLAQ